MACLLEAALVPYVSCDVDDVMAGPCVAAVVAYEMEACDVEVLASCLVAFVDVLGSLARLTFEDDDEDDEDDASEALALVGHSACREAESSVLLADDDVVASF